MPYLRAMKKWLWLWLFISLVGIEGMSQSVPSKGTVQILDSAMSMPPFVSRARRIWVYLPAGYETGRKRYPVLYMQDGQNLFDARTSFVGEWGVDEIADSMKLSYIIVGIDNGGMKRMQEYNRQDHAQFGKGEGEAYLEFIVNTLKPAIDQRFRTKKKAKYTAIAGSSMGGLISYYAGLQYPEVFGQLGIFSPSFWIVEQLESTTLKAFENQKSVKQYWYFYAGGKEGESMIPLTKQVEAWLKSQRKIKTDIRLTPEAQHKEAAWHAALPDFFSRLR